MVDWDNNGHGYKQTLQPYIKSADIWKCPSNPDSEKAQMNADPAGGYPQINYSYGANSRIVVAGWGGGVSPTLSFIKAPASKIVMAERLRGYDSGYHVMFDDITPDYIAQITFAGHLGTMNCLFVDGHVKSMRPLATATPLNMWGTMKDNKGGPTDVPGGDCDTSSQSAMEGAGINCDEVSQTQVAGLDKVQKKYQ